MKLITEIQNFLSKAQSPIVAIIGPTASGKTNLSLKLAKKFQGEIISTDSRQIYKEMPIATDVLPFEKREGISHHLIEIMAPDEVLSMSDYSKLAKKKIAEIYQKKHLPILVGGTGLYLSSILEAYDLAKVPPDEEFRHEMEELAQKNGNESVHKRLEELSPETAKKIHPNNLRYVIRALELFRHNPDFEPKKIKSPYETFFISLKWPRETLYEKIEKRVDEQFASGLFDEVKSLLAKGYDKKLPSMTALGVKELIPYLEGVQTKEAAMDILKRNTRRYAKRQVTWIKRYDNVREVSSDEYVELIKHLNKT